MIEMGDARQTNLAAGGQVAQEKGQRDRTRAARERDEHARVGAKQRVLADELPDAWEQHDHGRTGGTGWKGGWGGTDLSRRDGRPALPAYPPIPPILPQNGAGGRTRTVDLALMRRPL